MSKYLIITFILIFSFIFKLKADVEITSYSLGMSPKMLHDKLVDDKFVFTRFEKNKIHAIKKIFFKAESGNDLPDVVVSTKFEGKICEGKLYQFNIRSSYLANQTNLLLGRKQVYVYLKENNAKGGKIAYSKKPEESRVVETYLIDRNSGSGSIRGIEEIKIGITEDKSINLGSNQVNKHPLLVQYQFKNKWFCPS